jgi:hypothetical protein
MESVSNNTVILMLSGGRDSFLSACRLLDSDKNYYLKMVTFDNGCSYQSNNPKTVADRIIKKYGVDRAEYLGVQNISATIREFFFPYFNMKACDISEKYPGLTPSQFHCLICRTSMYIHSIKTAIVNNAKYIAEGGRKDQEFVIELPEMIEKLRSLVESTGLELLLPVYELNDNWERDNELMARGFLSKTYEPKCIIGVPVQGSVDEQVIKSVTDYYTDIIEHIIFEKKLLSNDRPITYNDSDYNELYK